MRLLGKLPLKFHLCCGRFVAWLMGSVLHYRRDVVMVNLARSFPDKKYEELDSIRKAFYTNLGYVIGEAIWFGTSSFERVRRQHIVEMTNPEVPGWLYEAGKSVIIISGHFGNWELSGGFEAYDYKDTPGHIDEHNACVIYKKLSSKTWDRIFRHNRTAPLHDSKGYKGYVEGMNVVRYMYTHKDEPKFYVFNTDQSPYSNSSGNIDLEFMHQPTKAMSTPAALAHKFGFAVLYAGMKRKEPGKYELTYTPICEDGSALPVQEIMEKFYALLQKDIEEQPESYIWSHKRWKHKIKRDA